MGSQESFSAAACHIIKSLTLQPCQRYDMGMI
jgi:hypothetical protein